jgi:hypothetical protein
MRNSKVPIVLSLLTLRLRKIIGLMPSITKHELIDDGEGQSDIEPSYRFVCSTSPEKIALHLQASFS